MVPQAGGSRSLRAGTTGVVAEGDPGLVPQAGGWRSLKAGTTGRWLEKPQAGTTGGWLQESQSWYHRQKAGETTGLIPQEWWLEESQGWYQRHAAGGASGLVPQVCSQRSAVVW